MAELRLGEFSISLTVQDLAASRAFYERFGFEVAGGDADAGWLFLRKGSAAIGLFVGMFEENILTFNPPDVPAIKEALEADGVEFEQQATGERANFVMLRDPDGNLILLDQLA